MLRIDRLPDATALGLKRTFVVAPRLLTRSHGSKLTAFPVRPTHERSNSQPNKNEI